MSARTYLVGGAVRDKLLNRSLKDCDYVVVGSTPEKMCEQGFKPVGAQFPVFLHPTTSEEYALARTEKKSGHGYGGFVFFSHPAVTLKEDLKRRDLTINAMAQDCDDGTIYDYHSGQSDLDNKILRHVSESFIEDPLRVMRVARFAAMLPDFTVAPETMQLMQSIVASGEMQYLHQDRIWKEFARGLIECQPSKMIEVLDECGAFQLIFPEVAALRGIPERLDYHPEGETFKHTMMVVDTAAKAGYGLAVCFAALLHDTGKALTPSSILPSHHGHEQRSYKIVQAIIKRLALPKEVADIASIVAGEHGNVHRVLEMRASSVVDLLDRLDALRRPKRFEIILQACEVDYHYLPERKKEEYLQSIFLRQALSAIQGIDQKTIAEQTRLKKSDNLSEKIAEQIRYARIAAIKKLHTPS